MSTIFTLRVAKAEAELYESNIEERLRTRGMNERFEDMGLIALKGVGDRLRGFRAGR